MKFFTSQHPWKVTAPAQKDQGETHPVQPQARESDCDLPPLLSIGRMGKARAGTPESAPASPWAKDGCQEGQE